MRTTGLLACILCILNSSLGFGQDVPAHFQSAANLIGKAGALNADGSYRINLPRTDLQFTNQNGMSIPVDMGIATFAAFTGTPADSLVVGDVAMVRHEIDGVIDALRAGGIEVVALHNHMTAENPRVFFAHFQGRGTTDSLAKTVGNAIKATGQKAPASKVLNLGKPIIDWAAIEKTMGVKPQTFPSGVVRFATGRRDLKVDIDGLPFLPGMGLGSWAAFHACECGNTMVMGDTCTTRGELQKSIDALRKVGISITAIHNHILGGNREVAFLHYEGEGDAAKMATGIRNCWDVLGKS